MSIRIKGMIILKMIILMVMIIILLKVNRTVPIHRKVEQ